MKEKILTLTLTACMLSALLCPTAAAESAEPTEEQQTVRSRVAYGTPTVDGKLDDAYLKSERIDYKLQPYYVWGFSDPFTEENVKKHFGWDTGVDAYSYFLWDESNIYIYTEVKDDTSGIVDFDKVTGNPGMPEVYSYQDGVMFNFLLDDSSENWIRAFSERGGRFYGLTIDYTYNSEYTPLKVFPYYNKDVFGLNSEYFATVNRDDGYVTEVQIPLTEKGAQILKLGSEIQQATVVNNYIDTLYYGHWSTSEDITTEPGFLDGVLYEEFTYGKEYDNSTISFIKRYIDLVGTDEGDLNGDGKLTVTDLVRLMKGIIARSEPSPEQDINLDGRVNVFDLITLMKRISRRGLK